MSSFTLKPIQKAPNEIVSFSDPRIKYPMYGSVKFDGFRCLASCTDNLFSSALKPFENNHLRKHVSVFLKFLKETGRIADCEIWSPTLPFNGTAGVGINGSITTVNNTKLDTIGLYVFDMFYKHEWENGQYSSFNNRYRFYSELFKSSTFPNVFPVYQEFLETAEMAESFYNNAIAEGHEGIMLRSPYKGYKHNRSTIRESWLLKFKDFQTIDAPLIDVLPARKQKDGIEREYNQFGKLKQPLTNDSFEVDETKAGSLVVYHEGQEVNIGFGQGFNDTFKTLMMTHRADIRKYKPLVEFSHMPHGSKNLPRMGKLKGFRHDLDPSPINNLLASYSMLLPK